MSRSINGSMSGSFRGLLWPPAGACIRARARWTPNRARPVEIQGPRRGHVEGLFPRRKRQANPEVKKAAEIYVNLYAARGVAGNWHELAKRLIPDYAGLSVEMQRYHRYRLRAQTHSYLYDQRSRLRRSAQHTRTR